MARKKKQAEQEAGKLRPITEYGFTEEEAGDIALGMALFDQWQDEFIADPDPRYGKLFRDYCEPAFNATAVMMLTGFFGGLSKGLEIALKVSDHKKEEP